MTRHIGPEELTDVVEVWPVTASRDLHRDAWVMALRSDDVRHPDQPGEEPFRRLVLEHPGAVIVLALDEQERVLLVRQYRHAAQRRFIELPAGLIDGDEHEEPVEVARRELREEAQYAAREWTYLLSAYSSPGISAELIHYFLATGLEPVDRGDFVLEHEEADMEVLWADFDDVRDAVLAGRLTDAPLVVAVLAYDARRRG